MAKYNEEQSRSLETKPVGRLLWEFAVPSIIAMSANSIYNFCDSLFLGRVCGSMAIAGMTITFPLMNIMSAFCALASTGGAALTSIRMGMKIQKDTHRILGNVLFLNLLFAFLLLGFGLTYIDSILSAFGASATTLPYARDYITIILLGIPVTHVLQSLLSQVRATGFPQAAMRTQLLTVLLNIGLDYIFIFEFGWGIKGAAFATILSQICALAYVLPRFFNKHNYQHFTRETLHVRWAYIREIFSIGIAPFLANISGFLIVLVINRTLRSYGGDMYVGAYGITNRISQLLIMMVAGFSQGLQPIVGYNLGAQRIERVRETLIKAVAIATGIMTVGYALIAIFPDKLAALFAREPDIIDVCVPALRIALITFPIVGSQMIAVSFFQSVHKAKLSMLITLSRQLLVLLPLLLWLPGQIGVTGVWWSMSLADLYSVSISGILLWRIVKQMKNGIVWH